MSELIMLVGLPGSGKSTYIKKINKDNDYVVISSDDILEELANLDGTDYNRAFAKHANFAGKEMFRRAESAIKNGDKIIWDQTNMNVKNRKRKLGMFPETYVKRAVVFSIDDAELNRRLKQRERETGKKIPDHVIKNMAASYQAPSRAEGFSKIEYIR